MVAEPPTHEPDPERHSVQQIRQQLTDALQRGPGPSSEQCTAWADRLDALWKHPAADTEADAEAALLAGQAHRACDDPEAATEAFVEAIRLGPRWLTAAAWVGRADLELDRADVAAAERYLRRALALDPQHPVARLGLTRLVIDRYGGSADPETFAEAEALARNDDRHDAWFALELARLLLYRATAQDAEAGEMHLVLASLRHEGDPAIAARVLLLTGLDHERNGEVVDATRAFAKAVELDPDATEAWAHLGLGQLQMRAYAEALEALSHAQQDRRFAERPDILRARAVALMGIRRLDGARLVYERLLELEPLNPANALGLAALAERRAIEAADRYERERHLADAALHYRELLHTASGDETAGVERARTFLRDYGEVEPGAQ